MNQTTLPAAAPTLARRFTTFLHALLFVLGFSLVFIFIWGGAATVVGDLLYQYKQTLAQVGGVIVILFGLVTLRVLKIPWLYYDTRPQWQGNRRGGLLASTLMGVFFAAGWTPCVGTTLGAILTLGAVQEKAGQAMILSSGYALGLGLPFLALGLGMDRATGFVRRFRKHLRLMEIVTGSLLILMGVLMLTQRIFVIAQWAQKSGLFLDVPLGDAATPTYFIAILAGLLSFLSPCVLPLVPAYLSYLGGHVLGGAARDAER
jgi:cytochrome c-type biogenesis protein